MHARVTQVRIRPGKLDEFTAAVGSVLPLTRQQEGFRALFVLRNAESGAQEASVISLWDSLDHLKNSEKNLFLYQALARLLTFCEGFPIIREQEVLISEFAAD
jgi:heme-degrading monooxygenase HmoA